MDSPLFYFLVMNQVNLFTPPQTEVVARGRETLLLIDAGGHHSLINLRESVAYDLFSKTFKFGIGKISNSRTKSLEPLYQSGQLIGFYLGVLIVLFDDDRPLSGLARSSTIYLATPLRLMEKCGSRASWKTLLSVILCGTGDLATLTPVD